MTAGLRLWACFLAGCGTALGAHLLGSDAHWLASAVIFSAIGLVLVVLFTAPPPR